MKRKIWQLPWKNDWIPHATIDILRGCNISCRACYNTSTDYNYKSLDVIKKELDALLKLRRLSSVSVLGGESTLHPDLCSIISMIHNKGLDIELVTNGVDVDEKLCRKLKEAGLTILYFHIERGQKRPEFSAQHSAADVQRLRQEKAKIAAAAGLDVGLTVTAFPGEPEDVKDAITLTLQTPAINYLLVTLWRDVSTIESLHGNIFEGFKGIGSPPPEKTRQNNDFYVKWMRQEFGFEPFAYMGSNLDSQDIRWLSYLIGVNYESKEECHFTHIEASLLEKMSLAFFRIFKNSYPMYQKQDEKRFRAQLLLNGLTGGRRCSNQKLINQSKKQGTQLRAKRILFQNPAELSEEGNLIYCRWCPDALLKNGSLVPICISDKVVTEKNEVGLS